MTQVRMLGIGLLAVGLGLAVGPGAYTIVFVAGGGELASDYWAGAVPYYLGCLGTAFSGAAILFAEAGDRPATKPLGGPPPWFVQKFAARKEGDPPLVVSVDLHGQGEEAATKCEVVAYDQRWLHWRHDWQDAESFGSIAWSSVAGISYYFKRPKE